MARARTDKTEPVNFYSRLPSHTPHNHNFHIHWPIADIRSHAESTNQYRNTNNTNNSYSLATSGLGMNVSQDEADRVLRLKSREREAHACYPCRKRKVKCDGHNPCRTCVRRKHPQICSYRLAERRNSTSPATAPGSARNARFSEASVNRNIDAGTQEDSQVHANTTGDVRPDDGSKNYVYSGDNSVVSILRLRASDANDSVAREVGSVLGLQNTFNSYPFMDSKTPHERWRSLLGILPQRTEVLK